MGVHIIKDNTKPKSNLVRNLLLFFGLIALTMFMLFRGQNPKELYGVIRFSIKKYLLIGFASILLYHFIESVNLNMSLRALGHPVHLLRSFRYTLSGAFFSGITPAATGGQPMEIYYMHKDGIPVGVATLALLLNLIGYQATTITFGFIGYFSNVIGLHDRPGVILFFIIGICVNIACFALILIGVYSERMAMKMARGIMRILRFFRVKKADRLMAKIEYGFSKYKDSAQYLKDHPRMVVRVVLLTFVQFLFYYSIAFWAYRALGFHKESMFLLFTLQALVFATVSAIPLPGAVGASEGAFIAIFEGIYPMHMIRLATLLTRVMNFYFIILLTAFIIIGNDIRIQRKLAAEYREMQEQHLLENASGNKQIENE